MSALRVAALTISLLLLTQAVQPAWGWFAALTLLAVFMLGERLGLGLFVVALLLLLGITDHSLAWSIVLVVLTAALFLGNLASKAANRPRERPFWHERRFRLS